MKRILKESRPKIFIEIWGKNKKNFELLDNWLDDNKYKIRRAPRGPNYLLTSSI